MANGEYMSAMDISASGLSAQRQRMSIIARNIAHANSLVTPEGGPYERREITFHTLYYIESSGGVGNLRPRLIGFTEELDREFFELLTTVGNLGTKTALRALTMPIAEMAAAIDTHASQR